MATSSIMKDFYVKDSLAFEKLKADINQVAPRKQVVESPSLKKDKEKLTAFVFR